MSIQSEINRINSNVQNTIEVIRQTGVEVPEGVNSDSLPSLASALANQKQDKLIGTKGQFVGFNESGQPQAQDLPENTFVVIMHYDNDQDTTVSNYTAQEIYDRVSAGQSCLASVTVDGVYYQGLNLIELNHTGSQYIAIFGGTSYHSSTGEGPDRVPGYFTYYKYVMSIDSSLAEPINYINLETVRMSAEHMKFENEGTNLTSTNVQAAIEEVGLLASGSSSSTKTVTLTVSGWVSGSDGRYYQTVSVPDITTTTPIIVVDCDLSTSDVDAKVEILTAWQGPSANDATQGNGTLTFYTYDIPTVNIPVNVGVM